MIHLVCWPLWQKPPPVLSQLAPKAGQWEIISFQFSIGLPLHFNPLAGFAKANDFQIGRATVKMYDATNLRIPLH
jgi:hypothetical protein